MGATEKPDGRVSSCGKICGLAARHQPLELRLPTLDGELIQTKWEAEETARTRDTKELICAITIAARRFPQTGRLRPASVKQLRRLSPLSGNRTLW